MRNDDAQELWIETSSEDGIIVSGINDMDISTSTINSLIQEAYRSGTVDLSAYDWYWDDE